MIIRQGGPGPVSAGPGPAPGRMAGPIAGGNPMSAQRGPSGPSGEKTPAEPVRNDDKHGRNEPCPCGSGKKYKNCCGREV